LRATGRYQDERVMRRRYGTLFWCRVEGRSATPEDPFARDVWCMADISGLRPVAGLTRRERQVAMLLTNAASARRLRAHRAFRPAPWSRIARA